ncbi:MAG: PA2169 family four-helix-bundle protein [Janthinobacterium lividum]
MATNAVSTLNDLIEVSRDGEQGFRKAAEDTKNAELKALFSSRAAACAAAVTELQGQVTRLGGSPAEKGTVAGALHRGWVDLKTAVSSRDDHAVLSECERGEDVAKKHYREALDKDLPADVRALVERQYEGVIANHDRVKALRDQYAPAQ